MKDEEHDDGYVVDQVQKLNEALEKHSDMIIMVDDPKITEFSPMEAIRAAGKGNQVLIIDSATTRRPMRLGSIAGLMMGLALSANRSVEVAEISRPMVRVRDEFPAGYPQPTGKGSKKYRKLERPRWRR